MHGFKNMYSAICSITRGLYSSPCHSIFNSKLKCKIYSDSIRLWISIYEIEPNNNTNEFMKQLDENETHETMQILMKYESTTTSTTNDLCSHLGI